MGARDARGEEVRGRGDEQGRAVNAERVPAYDGDRSRVDASLPGASALNQSRSTTRAVRRSPGRDIVAVARYDPRAPGVDATPTKVFKVLNLATVLVLFRGTIMRENVV